MENKKIHSKAKKNVKKILSKRRYAFCKMPVTVQQVLAKQRMETQAYVVIKEMCCLLHKAKVKGF